MVSFLYYHWKSFSFLFSGRIRREKEIKAVRYTDPKLLHTHHHHLSSNDDNNNNKLYLHDSKFVTILQKLTSRQNITADIASTRVPEKIQKCHEENFKFYHFRCNKNLWTQESLNICVQSMYEYVCKYNSPKEQHACTQRRQFQRTHQFSSVCGFKR